MKQKQKTRTKLNALILVGGKSTRMGYDKSALNYHGKAQWKHLVDILEDLVAKVYVSIRPKQKIEYPFVIEDKEENLGPFGAILTALETKPDEAFLVIASDLPFLNQKMIELLIENRDMTKWATALKSKNKDYAEPLACIWEPEVLSSLQTLYHKKIYKPIQVLKQIPIKTLLVEDRIVQNINTAMEYEQLKRNKKHLPDDLLSDI